MGKTPMEVLRSTEDNRTVARNQWMPRRMLDRIRLRGGFEICVVATKGGLMARTVYRAVSGKRRTTLPRSSSASAGMSTSFGRMLAKLALATDTLSRTRRRR
jgi:hypothetical protein